MGNFVDRCEARIARLMQRVSRLAGTFVRLVFLFIIRGIIFGVLFTICAMLTMYYMGLPMVVPPEVFDALQSVGRLTHILS